MKRQLDLSLIADRVFDQPLLIDPEKFAVIMHFLAPRFGLASLELFDEEIDFSAAEAPAMHGFTQGARRGYALARGGAAIIPVYGTTVRRSGGFDAMSGMTSYQAVEQKLTNAMSDPDVKGVLIDMDSAGGEAAGVFDLAGKIHAMRGTKPIRAVANELALSAGYAIASAADQVFVSKTGALGSIGVITAHIDRSKQLAEAGVKVTTIYAGKHKADGVPHEPLSDSARSRIQARVNKLYDIFAENVGNYRTRAGLTADAAKKTEADVFYGGDAVKAKLADGVGSFEEVLGQFQSDLARGPSTVFVGAAAQPEVDMEKEDAKAAAEAKAAADEKAAADAKAAADEKAAADAKAAENNVVSFDSVRKDATAKALEIVELCGLAGHPELVAGFLKEGASVDKVRQELLARGAAEGDGAGIRNHVDATATTAGGDPASSLVVKACEGIARGMTR